MTHLVPQVRLSGNLRLCGPAPHRLGPRRQMAAPADMACDYYLRVPAIRNAPMGASEEFVQFAKSVCQKHPMTAPPLRGAQPIETTPSTIASLGAAQIIGAAAAAGSTLGGQAGARAAKENKQYADVADEVALAVPGALLGGLTGLALAGRFLALMMPSLVRVG